jgi:IS30 family transposase
MIFKSIIYYFFTIDCLIIVRVPCSLEITNSELGCVSYFCQPYHSWEKGAVEQVNGLIRRYIPKGTDIQKINQRTIDKIEKLINNRPRKCLDYKTPLEVYNELYGALTT